MGKGDDPNCATGVAMPLPSAGVEEVLVQPTVDRVRIKRVSDDFVLVAFDPGRKDDDTHQAFFTDAEGYAAISTAPDPTRAFGTGQEIKRYYQLCADGPDILNEEPWESLLTGRFYGDEIFDDSVKVAKEDRFDPGQLLRADWSTHSFYRPGSERPVSRAYRLELWGTYHDIAPTLEKLRTHPWVRSAESRINPVRLNHDISGRELISFVAVLPQDVHDKVYDGIMAHDTYFTPNQLEGVIRYPYVREQMPEEVRDLFGINEHSIDRDAVEASRSSGDDHWSADDDYRY
jgi:hypothetical protein